MKLPLPPTHSPVSSRAIDASQSPTEVESPQTSYSPLHDILFLQRTLGNQVVQRRIQQRSLASNDAIQRKLPPIEIEDPWIRYISDEKGKEYQNYYQRYTILIDNEIKKLEDQKQDMTKIKLLVSGYKSKVQNGSYRWAFSDLSDIILLINNLPDTKPSINWDKPYTPTEKDVLQPTLQQVKLAIEEIVNDKHAKKLKDVFGDQDEMAKKMFSQIRDSLDAIYQKDLFFKDTNNALSSHKFGALASGAGENARIMIDPESLKDPKKLAVTLIHEGSHTLPDSEGKSLVIDFFYRGGWIDGYLPPEIALKNAASFEDVADVAVNQPKNANTIGLSNTRLRQESPMLGAALALASLRLTRTWIRLNDLHTKILMLSAGKFTREGWNGFQGEDAENIKQIIKLLNLPFQEQLESNLPNLHFRDLDKSTVGLYYDEATRMMNAFKALKVVEGDDTTGDKRTYEIHFEDKPIYIWTDAIVSEEQGSAAILHAVLAKGVVTGGSTAKVLGNAIQTIETWDRPGAIPDLVTTLKHIVAVSAAKRRYDHFPIQ